MGVYEFICLSYILGLFSTAIFNFPLGNYQQKWLILILGWTVLTIIAAVITPKFWRIRLKTKQWLIITLIALFGVLYFQLRIPQPQINDVSLLIDQVEGKSQSKFLTIQGKILSNPKITRSQNLQFWLEATAAKERGKKKNIVTGKLYVTVPLDKATDLYPGEKLSISGILYRPKASSNPGAFDFSSYLANQGGFAGLKGLKINLNNSDQEPAWGIWKIAKKIIRSQELWLGSSIGPLVSSMVLGSQRVDLPFDIKDEFIQAGLAHILAASGFQVSFLLGVVLGLTKRLSVRSQFMIGVIVIIVYIGLTGIQASVMRAGIMGIAALIGILMERNIKPLGSLLLAATVLLIFNPLWVWDLGFQLSFLATLGLVVTMPALEKQLDWLPSAIATAIALPLAASVWTLPLLMYVFFSVGIYSIPINIIVAPLVALISLVGMISALISLIWSPAGSAIAFLLYYPTDLLIKIVEFFNSLPGSSVMVGKFSLWGLSLIYGLMILIWLNRWWQKRWWLVALFIVTMLTMAAFTRQASLMQVTILEAKHEQILVIQDQGKVTVINSSEPDNSKYTLIPFLAYQGINRINCLLALTSISNGWGWSNIKYNLTPTSVKDYFSNNKYESLILGDVLKIGTTKIRLISLEPAILEVEIREKKWLILGSTKQIPELSEDIKSEVLIWSGKTLKEKWLQILQPQVAIATSPSVQETTQEEMKQQQVNLYWTGKDGAIEWTPEKGFQRITDITWQEALIM